MKKLISNIQYCKSCLMPSSRPRIVFNNKVCNACKYKNSREKVCHKIFLFKQLVDVIQYIQNLGNWTHTGLTIFFKQEEKFLIIYQRICWCND